MDLNDSKLSEKARNGPDRVIVTDDGYAVPVKLALHLYGVAPDIVFVRKDGWMLGAPRHLERVAYQIWEDEWIGYFRIGSDAVCPITEYQGKHREEVYANGRARISR